MKYLLILVIFLIGSPQDDPKKKKEKKVKEDTVLIELNENYEKIMEQKSLWDSILGRADTLKIDTTFKK